MRCQFPPAHNRRAIRNDLVRQSGQIILKVVNAQPTARAVRISLAGARGVQATGEIQVLSASDLNAVNTLDLPTKDGVLVAFVAS